MAVIKPITGRLLFDVSRGSCRSICRALRSPTILLSVNRCCYSQSTVLRNAPSQVRDESLKSTPPSLEGRRKRRKRNIVILALAVFSLNAILYDRTPSNTKIFDPPRFTPFTIVKREEITPNSVILTLRPKIDPLQSFQDPFKESWERGTWSVEVKQPELQIAREYTPLPPAQGDGDGYLRLYIRKEHKGEVSSYLHGLPLGGQVECRGPHEGVDLGSAVREVLFLAGGTGIAPALQVAHTLLVRRKDEPIQAKVRIVWANRKAQECVGRELELADSPGFITGRRLGVIVRQLKELQNKFPSQIEVEYLVDEEGTLLDKKRISDLVKSSSGSNVVDDSRLLFVSGPEGFVNFIAGPKLWEGGKEGQGQVRGILGQLEVRDWKVWKL